MDEVRIKTNNSRLYWLVFMLAVLVSSFVIYYFFTYDEKEVVSSLPANAFLQFEKDQNAYSSAVLSGKVSECQVITDKEVESVCEETITDSAVFNDAMRNDDITACEGIKNVEKRGFCRKAIEGDMNIANTSNLVKVDFMAPEGLNMRQQDKPDVNGGLIKQRDERCAYLETYDRLVNLALKESDASLCDCIAEGNESRAFAWRLPSGEVNGYMCLVVS